MTEYRCGTGGKLMITELVIGVVCISLLKGNTRVSKFHMISSLFVLTTILLLLISFASQRSVEDILGSECFVLYHALGSLSHFIVSVPILIYSTEAEVANIYATLGLLGFINGLVYGNAALFSF